MERLSYAKQSIQLGNLKEVATHTQYLQGHNPMKVGQMASFDQLVHSWVMRMDMDFQCGWIFIDFMEMDRNGKDKGVKITVFRYDKLSLKYVVILYPLQEWWYKCRIYVICVQELIQLKA